MLVQAALGKTEPPNGSSASCCLLRLKPFRIYWLREILKYYK